MFPQGYNQVTKALEASLPANTVRLGQVVTRVAYSKAGGCVVTVTQSGTEGVAPTTRQADYCVVSVPLGVLQAGTVAFEPALPAATVASMNHFAMGTLNKYALFFDTPFWGDEVNQFCLVAADGSGKYPAFLNSKFVVGDGGNYLLAFAAADYAVADEARADADVQRDLVAALTLMFPDAGAITPKRFIRTRWHSSPLSRGSYAFKAVGYTPADQAIWDQSLADVVYFAGEHTRCTSRCTKRPPRNAGWGGVARGCTKG